MSNLPQTNIGKMINEKELRKGNLVNYNGDVYSVSTIGLFGISGESKQGGFISKYSNLHLSPIPITTEWLRKFGFVFEDIGTNPTEEEKKYRNAEIGFGGKSFGIEFDTEKGTFILQNVVGELVEYQYVHHLQNVYYWNTFRELVIKDLDTRNVH